MKRKSKPEYMWIVYIIGILVLLYFLSNLKININVPLQNQSLSVVPNNLNPTYSSCNQVCSANGFSKYYTFFESCKAGESKITYGYPNQIPLLTCCCFNEVVNPTCTDSDGDDRDTVGHVNYDENTYTDKCLDVGQAVTEYICLNGAVSSKNWMCDYGEICMQTRSGGHCIKAPKVWNPGDTVTTGSGSASVIGNNPQTASIDLSDFGIEPNGNCRLGVQLQTSWSYSNDKCVGIPGMQGVKWDIYDSNSLEYSRTDNVPVSLGVDLHPESYIWNWDGYTPWRASMTPYPFTYPDCSITYEWSARIYIYDCI